MSDKFQAMGKEIVCWLPPTLTEIVQEYNNEFGGEYLTRSRIMVSVKDCADECAKLNLNQRLEWSCLQCQSELIFKSGWGFRYIWRLQQDNQP
jgi:hypothetical protein